MIIDLSSRLQGPLKRQLYKLAAPVVERSLSIRGFNLMYRRTQEAYARHPEHPSARAWFASGLEAVGGRYEVEYPPDFTFPKEGPLIIISNHPFGLLDPVILGDLLTKHRPDVRFMTNYLLGGIEEIKPWIIPVDPFDRDQSARRNLGPMKDALRFLKQGGALAMFPSGEVAHYRMGRGVEESPWSSHVGGLVRRTGATVLPVHFAGRNSLLFQGAGLVHPMLRTGLLLRELVHRHEEAVKVQVGRPLPYSRLKRFTDDEELTRYLRLHTFILGQKSRPAAAAAGGSAGAHVRSTSAPAVPEQAPLPRSGMGVGVLRGPDFASEISRLQARDGAVVRQGGLSVFVAAAGDIPLLLQEIGRLREVSFRAVGEGSGNEVDLDRFDRHYLHVFLWDEKEGCVAGAYRVGRADVILQLHGAQGLYTSTLFRFQKPFLQHLDTALELGRSFIAPKYQRHAGALPLLWKGVLTWVGRNPQYTRLFGPVSISQEYQGLSRKLMVEFLKGNNFHPDLATLVKPRKPFRYGRNRQFLREFISADLGNVDDFSALISCLEDDGKGIPVLLKHYLRLKGVLLSFNVDPAFASCLDGLILVDLTATDPRLLVKYMGEAAAAGYLRHHGKALPVAGGGAGEALDAGGRIAAGATGGAVMP